VYCRKVKIALEGKDHEVRDTVRPQECQSVIGVVRSAAREWKGIRYNQDLRTFAHGMRMR